MKHSPEVWKEIIKKFKEIGLKQHIFVRGKMCCTVSEICGIYSLF